ncbi:MAG: substrate-binding periplasmic protein [Geminicoccales bacterium]
MKRSPLVLAAFAVLLLNFSALAADRERVVITTLDWPPYTGSELPKLGATTEVVRQAFDQAGLDVDVQFLPWKRAIAEAKNGEAVAYYPGYHCSHAADFEASNPVGTGPLGFAEHIEAPISWETVHDLGEQKLKIGTVLGYANTDEFDEKVGSGWIRAISAKDDLTNLKKLLRRRIDAVVIDKLVMSYLVATEPSLSEGVDLLQFNERPLEGKILHVCFTEDQVALRDRFNEGLEKVNTEKVVDDYFANEF